MAYTNIWSVTIPAGSEQAKKIDDHIRQLRLDLQQRLLTIVDGMDTDPWSVKAEIRGKFDGKKLIIPAFDFVVESGEGYNADGSISAASAVQPLRAPVKLPMGVTIKKIRWLLSSGDSAAVTLTLKGVSFNTGVVATVLNTQTKSAAGMEIKDSGTITIAVDGNSYYFLEADKSSGAAFNLYAVEITYNTPDSRSTM